jgi:hypothetical protein
LKSLQPTFSNSLHSHMKGSPSSMYVHFMPPPWVVWAWTGKRWAKRPWKRMICKWLVRIPHWYVSYVFMCLCVMYDVCLLIWKYKYWTDRSHEDSQLRLEWARAQWMPNS